MSTEIDGELVHVLTASLVREYLSRKGCTGALAEMDRELPRSANSVNNRLLLARAMFIEPWMKRNKLQTPSFRTMVEVIVWNVIWQNSREDGGNAQQGPREGRMKHRVDQNERRSLSAERRAATDGEVRLIQHTHPVAVDRAQTAPSTHSFVDQVSLTSASALNKQKNAAANSNVASVVVGRTRQLDITDCFTKPNRMSEKAVANGASKVASTDISAELDMIVLSEDSVDHSLEVVSNLEHKQAVGKSRRAHRTKSKPFGVKPTHTTSHIDADCACDLRNLIFGSTQRGFTEEWTKQSFGFNNCEDGRPAMLRIGIAQKKGGPCGLLAAVQALVLKHFIFQNGAEPAALFLEVEARTRTRALEDTIAQMVWGATADGAEARLAVLSMRRQFEPPPGYRPDGVSENVLLIPCATFKQLKSAVHEHIDQYESGAGACLLLLYSAILTHGVDKVRDEMDEKGGRLMGAHGYCTQEIVNLLLHGEATSNAFDGVMDLGDNTVLRGVSRRGDVGLLSLFEHYGSCKIGTHFKQPHFPVWLVCSESHFSVLFSLQRELGARFDLYYYDGLANQDEVIRLTVDSATTCPDRDVTGALIPPLEHCIRTKWPRATISWNGSEPIL